MLLDLGIKATFGRWRPFEDDHDHNSVFHGGRSFVSGDVAPMFALAAGVSEYFDNRWDVAIPIYSLADVVGAALLGIGTTELFLYLHRQHEKHPWRFRVYRRSGARACRHDDRVLLVRIAEGQSMRGAIQVGVQFSGFPGEPARCPRRGAAEFGATIFELGLYCLSSTNW